MRRVFVEIEATQDEHFRALRGDFVRWVRALNSASTPADFLRLEVELRDRFAARQHAMRDRRVARQPDVAARRGLLTQTPRLQSEINELTRRIEVRDRLDTRDDVVQHISRCLMDGLAWRAVRYDRAFFIVMGDGERVGRLPDEAGAAEERERAQRIWDGGALPIFNDLTNCLREGDLTVLHGAWSRPDIAIDEVKRSGRAARPTRQSVRLDRKLRLLSAGQGQLRAEDGPVRIHRLSTRLEHHLDVLAAVVAQARRDGYAEAQPHPGA